MTGRELILYILENGLEDEQVFKDGKFVGFVTAEEAAVKMHVGPATIATWAEMYDWPRYMIGNTMFIPANVKLSLENFNV